MKRMESVRDYINELLAVGLKQPLTAEEETKLRAVIDEAQPPSVDEIYAALDKLAKARGESGAAITLYNNRMGQVEVSTDKAAFRGGDELAAIRSLIPRPEPTPAECLAVIEHLLDYPPYTGEERQRARDACSRLRKHITKD